MPAETASAGGATMDYMLFASGVLLLLLGAAAWMLRRAGDVRLRWGFTACFGALLAVSQWAGTVAFLPSGALPWKTVQVIALALAAASLLASCRVSSPRVHAASVVVLMALGACGAQWGAEGARLGFGLLCLLPGGLWVARSLARDAAPEPGARRALTCARIGIALVALTALVGGSSAASSPAASPWSVFVAAVGLVHLAGAALLAGGVWWYHDAARQRAAGVFDRGLSVRARVGIVAALACVLGGGWVATETLEREMLDQWRASLLARVCTLAASLSAADVAALTGTSADLASPAYLRLKETLAAVRARNPEARFVYLTSCREGRIVFLADSEPPDSPDCSPAGQEYTEAAREHFLPFAGGKEAVTPPVADRWGTWVTAIAPLPERDGGTVRAAACMDLPAARWNAAAFRHRQRTILMTLVVLALAAILLVSSRRRAEALRTLARERDDFALLADSMGSQVWYLKDPSTYGMVNAAHAAFLGRTRETTENRDLSACMPETCARAHQAANASVLERKQPSRTEEWMPRGDGEQRLLSIVRTPRLDARGEVAYVVCAAEDVTEARRAEELLRVQNDFALALNEARTPPAILATCLDTAMQLSAADAGALYLLDTASGVLRLACHRGLGEAFLEQCREFAADSPHALLVRSGEPRYTTFETLGLPISDEERGKRLRALAVIPLMHHGVVLGCLNVASHEYDDIPPAARTVLEGLAVHIGDATARVRAEEALQQARTRLELTIGVTGLGLWDWDIATGTVVFSREWAQMLGYELAEVEPHIRTLQVLGHPDDLAAVWAAFNAHAEGKTPYYEAELRMRAKSGEWRWVLDRGKIIERHANGAPRRVIGVDVDITERKRDEERVAETNRQLWQARARARELERSAATAGKAACELLAGMSHELRTPIDGLLGLADRLWETMLVPEQQRFAEGIRHGAATLLALLDDMRDLAKLQSGAIELATGEIDPRALLQDAIAAYIVRAKEKHLALHCVVDPDVPARLRGDVARLRQILLALLDNAVKFTDDGSIVVLARAEELEADAVTFRCEIHDTGIGIPHEKLALLFQPFVRLEAPTARRPGAPGLGLALSRALAERMGGDVGVESTPGKGSKFWFTARLGLPASPAAAREETGEKETAPQAVEG